MRPYASLRRQVEFNRLRERGRRVSSSGLLTVYRAELRASERRSVVGITVGKPVGTAVVRNKVRRRLAAILDQALEGRRMRLLIVARPQAATAHFEDLRNAVHRALV
jgi:ribonuclease P protein component